MSEPYKEGLKNTTNQTRFLIGKKIARCYFVVAATTNGSTTMRRHVFKKPFRSLVDQKPEASMPPKLIVVGDQTGLFMPHKNTEASSKTKHNKGTIMLSKIILLI